MTQPPGHKSSKKKSKSTKSTSSRSSKSALSTKDIENIVDKLRFERNRDSTRKNYHTIWKIFNEFFIRLDRKPSNLENRLVLFTGYLIENKQKPATIHSYISAIRAVLWENNIELNDNKSLLSSLTRACRFHCDAVKWRLPIRCDMMNQLLSIIKNKYSARNQLYLATLYTALFSMYYYGLIRIGELAVGTHPILAKDVQIAVNKKKIKFTLWTSKTHWLDEMPQIVKICSLGHTKVLPTKQATAKQLCPYQLLRDYVELRRSFQEDREPFFVFKDKSGVPAVTVRQLLKVALTESGYNPEQFSVHSLRTGHTSDLLSYGVSVETIKKLGHWKSNVVFHYLR